MSFVFHFAFICVWTLKWRERGPGKAENKHNLFSPAFNNLVIIYIALQGSVHFLKNKVNKHSLYQVLSSLAQGLEYMKYH